VKFMLESGKKSPMRVYALVPSCIPSVEGAEGSGAKFTVKEVEELLGEDGILGIAEVMDFVGVINDVPRMPDIVQAGIDRGMFIQGHAPGIYNKELSAYFLAGPTSCHESRGAADVRQKLREGVHVNLQSSSLSIGMLPGLLDGTKGMKYTDNVSICTDDIHAGDILTTGHINRVIKHALGLGVDPVEALRWATYNPAREYGITDLGAIAPGFVADMQLLDEIDGRNPSAVFVGGKLIVEDSKLVEAEAPVCNYEFPNTVNMPQITGPENFMMKAPEGCGDTVKTLVIVPNAGILYKAEYEELPVKDGYIDISGDENLTFVALCNRHGSGDMTLAVYRDFGLEKGALASTISHDCHNFTVAFKKAEDAYAAAVELARVGGGITAIENGAPISTLALPVAGLMSTMPCEAVAENVEKTQAAVATLCYGKDGMLMKTAVMALACLPCVMITDKGVYDGLNSKFVPVFAD
ncbi:MAG: adenine deaminase, partial [Clostridia bacterium]|nr:adenine deaminase [Clostridia bacterium]